MYNYVLLQIFGTVLVLCAILFFVIKAGIFKKVFTVIKRKSLSVKIAIFVLFLGGVLIVFGDQKYSVHFAMPAYMHSVSPDNNPPSLPILNMFNFLSNSHNFENVKDISANPNSVPAAAKNAEGKIVKMHLTTKEVMSEIAPGIYNNYWTFNGQVPGPMLRAREGDTIELTLSNDITSQHDHTIDLHAVTGPGGGSKVTRVKPGESKTFSWKALQPGLFIYHCATSNVSVHNSHGQYGLIMIDPKIPLPKVDKEFYLVQGELYTMGGIGKKGLVFFDPDALLDGKPTYVTFNGKVQSENRLKVKKGEKVRMYVGNGGVNLVSSFHVIGEIFDTVYPEGAMGPGSSVLKNVQTTAVLPGGSTIVEFKADVPGTYVIVDHALARMNKGAWATLEVEGAPSPDIFKPMGTTTEDHSSMGHQE